MSENFVIHVYDDALEVVRPDHYRHTSAETAFAARQAGEVPKIEHSGVEIGLTVAGGILGSLVVGGAIVLNNRHNRKLHQRQKLDDIPIRNHFSVF